MGQARREPDAARQEPARAGKVDLREVQNADRASETRRLPDRAIISRHRDEERKLLFVLPQRWYLAVITYIGALVVPSIVIGSLPGALALMSYLLGIMLAAGGIPLAHWERARQRPLTRTVIFAVTVLCGSSMLVGTAFALWLRSGQLAPEFAVAALLCVNAILATLLNGRTAAAFSCLVLSWAPVALIDFSSTKVIALAISTAVAVGVYRLQIGIDRRRAERRETRARVARRAQDILADFEEAGHGWFWETDRRGQISYISKSAARAVNADPSDLIGKPMVQLFEAGSEDREGERTISFHLSARSSFQDLMVRAASEWEVRWWSITGRPIYDNFHNFCGFRGSGSDLTEKKRSEENATRLALYDSLTGLANRLQMSQNLDKILCAPLERDRECSVFLLDLDRFKQVNDTMGHPAGDALLKRVAKRLERSVEEAGLVGRLGGDEFKVILPGRWTRDQAAALAAEIIHSLSQPYTIDGQVVLIGASIGIAQCPQHATQSESLIRNADLALYAAKDGGRGRFNFYSSRLHTVAEERSELEKDLRAALADGALELHYQPVINAATEKLTGFEALLRWKHPQHGWMSPSKFIPIAEDTGLIVQIGEWALRRACSDMAEWSKPVRCAVNVSPLQFADNHLPAIVTSALAASGIEPSRLELELTESVFLSDDANTDAMFATLKKIGVRLALDDFGTGYSSLGYLKKAPFDKIKIDQSFVRGATQSGSRNGAIMASIINLAQSLDMETTAEGVETMDELDLIRELGCSHVQGHIYERALSPKMAKARLKKKLTFKASGPRSARTERRTMFRKIMVDFGGTLHDAKMRNISETGALVEGVWNVPAGAKLNIAVAEGVRIPAISRWSARDRMGVQFVKELERQPDGGFLPEGPPGSPQFPAA